MQDSDATLGTCALDLGRLARELQAQRFGRSIAYRELTQSTNDDAKRALGEGLPSGHVVIADAQSAGRGSRGHTWVSPPGTDLYLSILDRPVVALADLPPLTLAVGLAVAESVDALLADSSAQSSSVKWPNDVLIAGKKLAGVLIETSLGAGAGAVDGVVIGIGLNVNRTQFSPELCATATSLRLCHQERASFDRTAALCTLLARVELRVDQFIARGAASIVAEIEPRLAYIGQRVRCGEETGYVRGLAPSGALLLETPSGLHSLVVGPIEPVDSPDQVEGPDNH